ncbi:hypothetical protein BH11PSE8_BH11PSE8_18440 [soil metagenome]
MAYYLVTKLSLPADIAISRVKAVRPIAFTAPGWSEFAHVVLAGVLSGEDST